MEALVLWSLLHYEQGVGGVSVDSREEVYLVEAEV
jgi:hypothetical protein